MSRSRTLVPFLLPTVAALASSQIVPGTTCGETQLLSADIAHQDLFGRRVSLHGRRALVGATSNDDAGGSSGAAYVFELDASGSGWTQAAKLVASDATFNARFGSEVRIAGERAFIGAVNHPGGAKIYVFERDPSGAWLETAQLIGSASAPEDRFGHDIATDGDRVLIGAPGSGASGAGAAYIFELQGTVWIETALLTASDADPFDTFGDAVALAGDRITVGASGDSEQGSAAGAAYVFELGAAGWQEVRKLQGSQSGTETHFGLSLDLSGDVLAVGAPGEVQAGGVFGAVYVFDANGGAWNETARIVGGPYPAALGAAIDLDGDRLVSGSADIPISSAFVFERSASGWTRRVHITREEPTHFDHFGQDVALDGSRVLIGADEWLTPGTGSAFVYELIESVGTPYCATGANSTGAGASLSATGNPDPAVNCLELITTGVPANQPGYYLVARAQGMTPLPGASQGTLCLALPLVRFAGSLLDSGNAGVLTFTPDLTALPQGTVFLPGETWSFQSWFRDANPAATSNTSGGLAVTFATPATPTVQLPVSFSEVTEDSTTVAIDLTLSQSADEDVVVTLAFAGTATPDVDYRFATPTPVTIPAGARALSLDFTVSEDTLQEGDETVVVTVTGASGASLGTSTVHTLVLRDDD
ncbi:MAG: hypothetical protein GY711_12685 [bacterium]|nr:hypothetical protein [bacterium]